jgi:hypothetical protein
MRKMLDQSTRLLGMGFNKLVEEWKSQQGALKNKMRFLLKTLTNQDLSKILQAYNAMKERKNMLEGVEDSDQGAKMIQAIKRLVNKPFDWQCQAYGKLIEFLKSDRQRESHEKKEKERILNRIMSKGLREMGQAFTQALHWTSFDKRNEQDLMFKQRGIMRKILDTSVRLTGMGFNKLVESWKNKQSMLRDRLKFVLKTLTDQDSAHMLLAYNGMKARKLMLDGVGKSASQAKQTQLLKRLTNKGHDLQCQAWNQLASFLKFERLRGEEEKVIKERYLKRVMDSNARFTGLAFRQAQHWAIKELEKERTLFSKQRGILKKILDVNVRLMGMGYNKLLADSKHRQASLRAKLQFLLKTLTDQDAAKVLQAYNALKRRKMMLDGVGLSDQDAKKAQFLKRLTNKPFDLQCQAYSKFMEFLKSDRKREQDEKEQWARDQKERERILRRIMNKGIREMGQAYTQAFAWTSFDRRKEFEDFRRKKGIMRKILDQNVRLMGMGFNKLIESWKARQGALRTKCGFVIKTLKDQDLSMVMIAYNAMKQYRQMIEGISTGLRMQFLKKLLDNGYALQHQAMKNLTAHHKACKSEDERLHLLKSNIVSRISDSNVRLVGQGFRLLKAWAQLSKAREQSLALRQRGIMKRIMDINYRLMGMGFTKLREDAKRRTNMLRGKLTFVLKTLTNADSSNLLQAYNQLKARKLMMDGVGLSEGEACKARILKRLTNVAYDLTCQGWTQLIGFYNDSRYKSSHDALRQKGVCNRMLDVNTRLLSMGYVKLLESAKMLKMHARIKMKFILSSLQNLDKGYIYMAYNGLKERAQMLNGITTGLRMQFMKKMLENGYYRMRETMAVLRKFVIEEQYKEHY